MYINRHACLLWLHWQSHLHDEDAKCHEWKGEVCVRSFTHEGPLLLRVILYTNLDSMIMIIISSDCMLLLQLTHSLMTIDSVFLTSSGKRDLWVELHSFSIEIEESLTAWFRWTGDKGVSSQERVTVIWLLFGRKSTTQDEGLIVLCVLCSLETRFVCLWSLPCLSCVCVSNECIFRWGSSSLISCVICWQRNNYPNASPSLSVSAITCKEIERLCYSLLILTRAQNCVTWCIQSGDLRSPSSLLHPDLFFFPDKEPSFKEGRKSLEDPLFEREHSICDNCLHLSVTSNWDCQGCSFLHAICSLHVSFSCLTSNRDVFKAVIVEGIIFESN